MMNDLKRIGRALYLFVLGVLATTIIVEIVLETKSPVLLSIGLFCFGYLFSAVVTRWSSEGVG